MHCFPSFQEDELLEPRSLRPSWETEKCLLICQRKKTGIGKSVEGWEGRRRKRRMTRKEKRRKGRNVCPQLMYVWTIDFLNPEHAFLYLFSVHYLEW